MLLLVMEFKHLKWSIRDNICPSALPNKAPNTLNLIFANFINKSAHPLEPP